MFWPLHRSGHPPLPVYRGKTNLESARILNWYLIRCGGLMAILKLLIYCNKLDFHNNNKKRLSNTKWLLCSFGYYPDLVTFCVLPAFRLSVFCFNEYQVCITQIPFMILLINKNQNKTQFIEIAIKTWSVLCFMLYFTDIL